MQLHQRAKPGTPVDEAWLQLQNLPFEGILEESHEIRDPQKVNYAWSWQLQRQDPFFGALNTKIRNVVQTYPTY